MHCPNCNTPRLITTETFQTPAQTIRTKKCTACKWTFTSREEISDDLTIRDEIRTAKRRVKRKSRAKGEVK